MSSSSSAVVPPSSLLPSLRRRRLHPFLAKLDSLAVAVPSRTRTCAGGRSPAVKFMGLLYPSRVRICCGTTVEFEFLGGPDPSWSRKKKRKKGFVSRAGEEEEDAFATGPTVMDVEAEIYEFMKNSSKPSDFPTKRELVAAGRQDLAEAVAAQGGWLALGWDLDGDEVSESRGGTVPNDGRVYEGRVCDDSFMSMSEDARDYQGMISNHSASSPISEDCLSTPSSSGRLLDTENVDDSGIEGILSRLEKERSLSLVMESSGKTANGWDSWRNGVNDPGDSKNSAKMWRSWSLQRAGFSMTNFEAAEIDSANDKKILEDDHLDVEFRGDDILQQEHNAKSHDVINGLDTEKTKIRLHLQHLEDDLTSAVRTLRTKVNGAGSQKVCVKTYCRIMTCDICVEPDIKAATSAYEKVKCIEKHHESSIEELHRLSDAREFQETEIMKARNKLRSIRAKLAVLEGKLSLEIIEAQKVTEAKQRRINAARGTSLLLRTTSIVWPNSASEVLLAGSFDGWTSQRKMERSDSGFSLQLKLYPGRFEIKFIVDGVWKVDPLRPIVHNNGHENNLLIVH